MKIENGTSSILYTFNEFELNQHDAEIMAEERKKVCEELEKWAEDTLSIQAFGKTLIEYENIKQKLNELKGE